MELLEMGTVHARLGSGLSTAKVNAKGGPPIPARAMGSAVMGSMGLDCALATRIIMDLSAMPVLARPRVLYALGMAHALTAALVMEPVFVMQAGGVMNVLFSAQETAIAPVMALVTTMLVALAMISGYTPIAAPNAPKPPQAFATPMARVSTVLRLTALAIASMAGMAKRVKTLVMDRLATHALAMVCAPLAGSALAFAHVSMVGMVRFVRMNALAVPPLPAITVASVIAAVLETDPVRASLMKRLVTG
jgi:hypothetical protein